MSFRARWHETKVLFGNQPLVYLFLRLARFGGKVCRIPGVGYVINDPHLARTVLAKSENVRPSGPGGIGDFINQCFEGDVATPFTLNGDEHKEQRRVLSEFVTGEGLRTTLESALAPEYRSVVEQLRQGKPQDIAAFTGRASIRVMAHMLGVRGGAPGYETCLDSMAHLGREISDCIPMRGRSLKSAASRRIRRLRQDVVQQLREMTSTGVADDSVIAKVTRGGYSERQAMALAMTLLLAGTETISSGFPRMVALLIDHGVWQALDERREHIDSAIDEGMRLTAPSPSVLQGVVEDFEVQGHRFRAGQRVIVALHNILLDRRWTDEPKNFRIDREQPTAIKNLWFGSGVHYCLGAVLANAFYRQCLEALLEVPGKPSILKRRATRGSSFPGYSELQIAFA